MDSDSMSKRTDHGQRRTRGFQGDAFSPFRSFSRREKVMNSGASGFIGAPVSKALLLAASGSSFLLQQRTSSDFFTSSARLFAFRHLGELAFGAVLLYYFRIFERHWGSERCESYVACSAQKFCQSGAEARMGRSCYSYHSRSVLSSS